jgi:hypothetical protein
VLDSGQSAGRVAGRSAGWELLGRLAAAAAVDDDRLYLAAAVLVAAGFSVCSIGGGRLLWADYSATMDLRIK